MGNSLDRAELPCGAVSGSEVLGDLGDADLSSDDEGVVVAVHGELALVDGVVVVRDDLVPDGVGGVDEVNVDDVEDLVEGLSAGKRLEAVRSVDRLSESVLALEDSELLLGVVDSDQEVRGGVDLVQSGESLEKSEEVDNSLLVDGEDRSSLLGKRSVDEDSLDDGSGSPLDSAVVSVDGSDDRDSNVPGSVHSSDSGDDSVLSHVQVVDSCVGSGDLSSIVFDSVNGGVMSVESGGRDGSVDSSQMVDITSNSRSGKRNNSVDSSGDSVDLNSEGTDDLRRAGTDLSVEPVVAGLSARLESSVDSVLSDDELDGLSSESSLLSDNSVSDDNLS